VDEVKSALDELNAARTSVDVATLGYKLAQEEVAQAQRRFAAGVTTNIEVITAQEALARASDNQIGALFQFNLSRAALARATGEIESMYAK
jgi:outer membrane protein